MLTSRRLISSQYRASGSFSSSLSYTMACLRVGAIHTRPPGSWPNAQSADCGPSSTADSTTNWSPRVHTWAWRAGGRKANRFWNGARSQSADTAYRRSVGAASCAAFAS